jgi:hypothetical protein
MKTGYGRRILAALVIALMLIAPLTGVQQARAQSSRDAEDAQALLDSAEAASRNVDPLVEGKRFVATQDAQTITGQFIIGPDDPVADFYLTFTASAPEEDADQPYDFGLSFHYTDEGATGTDYRLVFASEGARGRSPIWDFSNQDDPIDSGTLSDDAFPVGAGETYEVAVAVVGDQAAFSINGEAVTVLDVSDLSDAGRIYIGSGWFGDTSVQNRDVQFDDITLYSLDGETVDDSGPTGGDEGGSTGGREETTPTPEDEDTTTPESGGGYISPDYGFTVSYGSDWQSTGDPTRGGTVDLGAVTLEDINVFAVTNKVSTVTFYAGATTASPQQCIDADIATYQNFESYDFYSIAKDKDGNELVGPTDGGGYSAVIWVTNHGTDQDPIDPPVDATIYLECRPIVDGESMLLIEHYALDDQYNDEIAARDELLATLEIGGGGSTTGDETPEATATEEATTTSGAGEDITVTLDEVDNSGVSGEAVVSASGTRRSNVDVTASGAPEGALVVVQEGSCDDLSGNADFDAGSVDASGESSGRIRIIPADLSGEYAVTIVDADTTDYANPLACGDIS